MAAWALTEAPGSKSLEGLGVIHCIFAGRGLDVALVVVSHEGQYRSCETTSFVRALASGKEVLVESRA